MENSSADTSSASNTTVYYVIPSSRNSATTSSSGGDAAFALAILGVFALLTIGLAVLEHKGNSRERALKHDTISKAEKLVTLLKNAPFEGSLATVRELIVIRLRQYMASAGESYASQRRLTEYMTDAVVCLLESEAERLAAGSSRKLA